MKNQQIVTAWNKINPDQAAQERMLEHIRLKNPRELQAPDRSGTVGKLPVRRGWKAIAVATLSAVICLIATLFFLPQSVQHGDDISLPRSEGGVLARYIQDPPPSSSQLADLAWLTEEELFSWHNPVVFRGTVLEIRNIQLDFNGSESYRAVAKIQVKKIYRGESELTALAAQSSDNSVTLLLPCPIQSGLWIEDTGVASALRVGMEGIFMPVVYDDDVWNENGASLFLNDLADCGLPDGERYLFLDADGELILADWAYPSLSQAQSLEDVDSFIEKMLD